MRPLTGRKIVRLKHETVWLGRRASHSKHQKLPGIGLTMLYVWLGAMLSDCCLVKDIVSAATRPHRDQSDSTADPSYIMT